MVTASDPSFAPSIIYSVLLTSPPKFTHIRLENVNAMKLFKTYTLKTLMMRVGTKRANTRCNVDQRSLPRCSVQFLFRRYYQDVHNKYSRSERDKLRQSAAD